MGDKIVPKAEQFDRVKRFITSPKSMGEIAMALPKHITKEKMARVVVTAILRTPKLLECEPVSIMDAVLQASQLGLLPDGVLGHGYILPYRNKQTGKYIATFIPGYKGLIDLARRSGEIAWLQARPVFDGDDFGYELGMENTLWHIPARVKGSVPGKFKAVYAIAKFKDGEYQFEVMYKDEVETVRKQAHAAAGSAWDTNFEAMALKTAIRRLCKFLPLNPEYQSLVAKDEYAEAGVLGEAMSEIEDVDADGVVSESVDPLDLIASQLEGAEIPDPRFEKASPKAQTPPPGPPDAPPGDPDPPGGAQTPDSGPDDSGDPQLSFDATSEGTGRISKAEDANFLAAFANLQERMKKAHPDAGLIHSTIMNRLGVYGAEKPIEIRSRLDREKFMRDLFQMCELWEGSRNVGRD